MGSGTLERQNQAGTTGGGGGLRVLAKPAAACLLGETLALAGTHGAATPRMAVSPFLLDGGRTTAEGVAESVKTIHAPPFDHNL